MKHYAEALRKYSPSSYLNSEMGKAIKEGAVANEKNNAKDDTTQNAVDAEAISRILQNPEMSALLRVMAAAMIQKRINNKSA